MTNRHKLHLTDILLSSAFVVYGFVSLGTQIILLRELSVVFYGNELFIGFSLASWLLWVGAGSFIGRKRNVDIFPLLFSLMALLIPLEISMTRIFKPLFGFGMLIGPVGMTLTTALLLAPVGLVTGAIFSVGAAFSQNGNGPSPSRIYFLESIGAVLFGALYTLWFSGRFENYTLGAFLCILMTLTAPALVRINQQHKRRVYTICIAALVLSLPVFDKAGRSFQWRGYQVLAAHDSRYSNLVLTKTANLMQLFQDGLITAHFPDPQEHEEIVHLSLLAHSNPRNVLLIGGGTSGELRQILKHPVRSVDYVEIDRALPILLAPFLPEEDQKALLDVRLAIHHEDGRAFLKHAKETYDAVILNLPEPHNSHLNRFYTLEFFKEVKQRLSPHGLVALKIPSSENYLPPEISFFNRSIFCTLQASFGHVAIIPGQSVILIARDQPIAIDPALFEERYIKRDLANILVVPSYFPIKLDPDRILFFKNQLSQGKMPDLNRDFNPVTYFHAWRAWLLKFENQTQFLWMIVFLAIAVWGFRKLLQQKDKFRFAPQTTLIFLLGFSAMVYEITLLLAFQSVHGAIYWQIGFLFASLMAGLALGSSQALRQTKLKERWSDKKLLRLFWIQAAYGVLLSVFLLNHRFIPGLLIPILFNLLMVPVGFVVGYGFSSLAIPLSSARLYAADLWGSALGALVTGLFLIPLLGLIHVFWFTALLLVAAGFFQRKMPG